MNRVLPHLITLGKVFQQNKIHYSAIEPSLKYTKKQLIKQLVVQKEALETRYKDLELTLDLSQEQMLVNFCNDYISALIKNLDRRFTKAAPVIGAFCNFNPPACLQQVSLSFLNMVWQM